MHSAFDADLAGFRNGFAGCPCLPYSRTLAILALLPPSERGSEKPILMSWLPSRFSLTGQIRPSDCTSSPVERESYFVPLPMTVARLLRTFARTTLPPASRTFSVTASVSLRQTGELCQKLVRELEISLCQWWIHSFSLKPRYTFRALSRSPRKRCRSARPP